MKPRTIHEAVDQLVNAKRVLLFKDENGHNIRGDVPSLLDQLQAAVSRDGNGSGSRKFGSRPPISVGVTALLINISTVTAEAVTERHGEHLHNITGNLRRIAADRSHLPATDLDLIEWTDRIAKWCDRARTTLGIEPKYPKGLRGVSCPNCQADSAPTEDEDGQTVRVPALQFEWSEAHDTPEDEVPPDRTIRAVICRMCGATWWAGVAFYELQAQIDQVIADNLTNETMGCAS